MKWFGAIGLVPGIGPLAGAIGGVLAKPAPLEPEIPTAMDDWDREFEERTGRLPSFSRLVPPRRRDAWMDLAERVNLNEEEPDALSFAGKR